MALDAKESEKGDDERRRFAEKVAAVLVKEKNIVINCLPQKIKTGDDAPNDSNEEDNLGGKKESKHKSLADEQLRKEGKSDINVEGSVMQLPVLDNSLEKASK